MRKLIVSNLSVDDSANDGANGCVIKTAGDVSRPLF